jgi:RNA polymerase sigma-70 factor (ECF subfamily)
LNQSDQTHDLPCSQAEDHEKVQQVLAGDTQAFSRLIDRHQQAVAGIVSSKVPHQDTVEVTHMVFIRAFSSLAAYRPIAPFRNWLATLAVRTCYEFWRKQKRIPEIPLASLSEAQRSWLLNKSSDRDAVSGLEAQDLLAWPLSHLSAADRMALTLVHLEGKSVAQTAELLG